MSRFPLLIFWCSSVALLTACSSEEPISTSGMTGEIALVDEASEIDISVLSTKSWLITGGDALIEVSVNSSNTPQTLLIFLNDQNISNQFVSVSSQARQALLSDLPLGDSTLTVEAGTGGAKKSLTLTNYPASGPIISGPHESPFYCQSDEFELVTGEFAGPALDLNCSIASSIDYVYWSTDEQDFLPLDRAAPWPDDVGSIDDQAESSDPFVVRVETGTVNRAIYEIAMLHDPRTASVDPWNRSRQWNNNLVFTHGGGCRGGWHQQGATTGGVLNKGLLEQGYALTSSSLNVFGNNCNDLLASETHIMLKERFIEGYGVPTYTIATGVSGGSYQSHQTADNYPGVFDGIIVGLSFPDVTSSTIFTLADARLLNYYFTELNSEGFSQDQQQAVSGFGVHASIANLSAGAARLDPLFEVDAVAEEQGGEVSVDALRNQLYSDQNPAGVRATVYDHSRNVYGNVENSVAALRPLDNIGVQYGLTALKEGVITPRQFIDLNRDIGGFDRDLQHVPQRHRADAQATKAAIESGRILSGSKGLAQIPIIDYRSYLDDREQGDIHMIVHQFATKARLVSANGDASNQVMQVGGQWGFTEDSPDLGELFKAMDEWILASQAQPSHLSLREKVISSKPMHLVDACWDGSGSERVKIEQEQIYQSDSECSLAYPAFSTPRQVAGGPLSNDIVSCRLKAVNAADYGEEFTPEELGELYAVFPQGVCDWLGSVNNNLKHQGVWLSFGPSPVNRLQ